MAIGSKVKVSGSWKKLKKHYVKVGGSWKKTKKIYAKVNNVWKLVWRAIVWTSHYVSYDDRHGSTYFNQKIVKDFCPNANATDESAKWIGGINTGVIEFGKLAKITEVECKSTMTRTDKPDPAPFGADWDATFSFRVAGTNQWFDVVVSKRVEDLWNTKNVTLSAAQQAIEVDAYKYVMGYYGNHKAKFSGTMHMRLVRWQEGVEQ